MSNTSYEVGPERILGSDVLKDTGCALNTGLCGKMRLTGGALLTGGLGGKASLGVSPLA